MDAPTELLVAIAGLLGAAATVVVNRLRTSTSVPPDPEKSEEYAPAVIEGDGPVPAAKPPKTGTACFCGVPGRSCPVHAGRR